MLIFSSAVRFALVIASATWTTAMLIQQNSLRSAMLILQSSPWPKRPCWCNKVHRVTPTNYVAEILQKRHFINTLTNPKGCHMSNFICQNDVNMANEPLKVEQPLLESSSEIDKFGMTCTKYSPDTKITVMGSIFPYVMGCFYWLTLGQLKYSI